MKWMVMAIAGAALALPACGQKGGDGNEAAEAGLTAEAIATNDVTAIDAVTGDAANMAADVDYTNMIEGNEVDAEESSSPKTPRPRAARPAPASEPPATEPAQNAAE